MEEGLANTLAGKLGKEYVPYSQAVHSNEMLQELARSAAMTKLVNEDKPLVDATGHMLIVARAPGLAKEVTEWGKAAKGLTKAVPPVLTPASIAKAYTEQQVVGLPPISPSALVAETIDTAMSPSYKAINK